MRSNYILGTQGAELSHLDVFIVRFIVRSILAHLILLLDRRNWRTRDIGLCLLSPLHEGDDDCTKYFLRA